MAASPPFNRLIALKTVPEALIKKEEERKKEEKEDKMKENEKKL
ncbi:MAG: hypothetical protein Q8P67_10395 [archaeon]|nr:hypothetical protein [archaeon]